MTILPAVAFASEPGPDGLAGTWAIEPVCSHWIGFDPPWRGLALPAVQSDCPYLPLRRFILHITEQAGQCCAIETDLHAAGPYAGPTTVSELRYEPPAVTFSLAATRADSGAAGGVWRFDYRFRIWREGDELRGQYAQKVTVQGGLLGGEPDLPEKTGTLRGAAAGANGLALPPPPWMGR